MKDPMLVRLPSCLMPRVSCEAEGNANKARSRVVHPPPCARLYVGLWLRRSGRALKMMTSSPPTSRPTSLPRSGPRLPRDWRLDAPRSFADEAVESSYAASHSETPALVRHIRAAHSFGGSNHLPQLSTTQLSQSMWSRGRIPPTSLRSLAK